MACILLLGLGAFISAKAGDGDNGMGGNGVVYWTKFHDGACWVYDEASRTYSLLTTDGRLITPEVEVYHVDDNDNSYGDGLWGVYSGGTYSYIDSTGKVVLSLDNTMGWPSSFRDGRALLVSSDGDELCCRFIDITGDVVLGPYSIAFEFSDGLTVIVDDDGVTTCINTAGETVFTTPYAARNGGFSEGLLSVYDEATDKHGYLDKAGNVVIPFLYDLPGLFSEGLAVVYYDGCFGYINKAGSMVISPRYRSAYPFNEGLALVEMIINDQYRTAYIDRTGNIVYVVPDGYYTFYNSSDGLIRVSRESDYLNGFVDRTGAVIVPFQYDYYDIGIFNEGYAPAYVDGKWIALANPKYTPSSWARPFVTDAVTHKLIPDGVLPAHKNNITRLDFCRMAIQFVNVVTAGEGGVDAYIARRGLTLPDPYMDCGDMDVLRATALGIVGGTGNGFEPKGLIDRQSAARMLALTCQALQVPIDGKPDTAFADQSGINSWARPYVNFVAGLGVMGVTNAANNTFSPRAPYTVESSIVTFERLYTWMMGA
jgi:hypothetical protein